MKNNVFANTIVAHSISILSIFFCILFSGSISINCSDDETKDELITCAFNGPGVFDSCVVSDNLCIEFHDGGVGDSVCNNTYYGTWAGEEDIYCPTTGITGKCHIGADATDSNEWVEFHYDENDTINEAACISNNGQWCNF